MSDNDDFKDQAKIGCLIVLALVCGVAVAIAQYQWWQHTNRAIARETVRQLEEAAK